MTAPVHEVDAFELPEWLGTSDVIWAADHGVQSGHLIPGRLSGTGHDDVVCDLLAVDQAFPRPVIDADSRLRAHLAWHHGQVLLGDFEGRLTIAAPGSSWGPDAILEALARLAKAVGARPERYAVLMRLGSHE